jgi:MraZ protein
MLFTGTYEKTLDEKRRVALPKRFRDGFGGESVQTLFLSPGWDQSLMMYDEATYQKVAERLSEKASSLPDARHYLRAFYSQTEQVEIDKQGRFCLPDRLVSFAHIKRDVVFLGVHDHVEVWDQERWKEYYSRQAAEFDQFASQVMTTKP